MIARLGMVLYWCGVAVASLCEIAALALGILIFTVPQNGSAPDAWLGAAFLAVFGGLSWLAGRAAKYTLAGT